MASPTSKMPTPPPENASNTSSTTFDISAYYSNILRTDPDITQPIAAIESLIALLSASPPSTISETLALIESSTRTLKASVTNPIALSAGTDLFQRYIISTLQSGSAEPEGRNRRAADTSIKDDFGAIRAHLLANSKIFVQRAKESRGSIARIAKRFVQDGSIVLTCGHSRVVKAVLEAAAADGMSFQVIYAQAHDNEGGLGGKADLVKSIRRKGVPVATIQFAALAMAMSRASFCIVGAESVVENGGVISSLGTQQVGLLAHHMKRPLYVAAESHKFVRVYPLEAEDLGLENDILDFRLNGHEDWEKGRAQYHNLDFTPPELITSLITEAGVHSPSAVSEELIKIWN